MFNSNELLNLRTRANDTNEKITIIMPAKNAEKFVERTLQSVANQSYKKNIEILCVYAHSDDNTLDSIKDVCKREELSLRIHYEKGKFNPELSQEILPTIRTKYFAFMCFSDEYYKNTYIEDSVNVLENCSHFSFVHSNVYTMYHDKARNIQSLGPGLLIRQAIPPESGARMFANCELIGDSIHELTFVCRTATANNLLISQNISQDLIHNTFGSLFVGLFLNGCIGYYDHSYSSVGFHHDNQASLNPDIDRLNGRYRLKHEKLRTKINQMISQNQYFWKDPSLSPFALDMQHQLCKEYNEQKLFMQKCYQHKLFDRLGQKI